MLYLLSIVALIVVADQYIKYLVVSHMVLGESIPIIPNYLHLTYILNPGAAFGILANKPYIFLGIGCILVILMIVFMKQIRKLPIMAQIAISCLVGGAIGNMIDRFQIQAVVDYVDFKVWPIFNLADVAIVFGSLLLTYCILMGKGEEK